jgi:general secretion pathway protein J
LIDGKLTRRESSATRDLIALDALWQAALSDTDTRPAVLLQTGVAQMALRLWQGGEWRPATNSLQSQSVATLAAPAASGLEVALTLQGASLVKVFLLGPL